MRKPTRQDEWAYGPTGLGECHVEGRRMKLQATVEDMGGCYDVASVALPDAVPVRFRKNVPGREVDLCADHIVLSRKTTCAGCGSDRMVAIKAVIAGKAACCPDCTTLTVDERNEIREAMKGADHDG